MRFGVCYGNIIEPDWRMAMKAAILVLAGAAGLLASGAAGAQSSGARPSSNPSTAYVYPQYIPPARRQTSQIAAVHRARLEQLRADALDLRERDGGALTAAHYAQIQSKLDAINADYRRYLRNNDVLSVGTGARR
jgi:hypothetical protein